MKHKITHNLGLKLLSVVIACLIWLVVMENSDPESTQQYRNIPVTIVNQDTITNANKTYTVIEDTDRVNVYVTARRSVRSRLSVNSFTVKADMENYNADIGSVPLEITCTDPRVSQENMRVQPSSLKISMEDKIEESFGIVASISTAAPRGYELGNATVLTGDTIRIAGPQSLLRIIGKVTVPVDITSKTADSVEQLPIRIEDKNGSVLTESQMNQLELKNTDGVVLQNNMAEVQLEIWKIYEEIALRANLAGEPAAGYEVTGISISPKTVNLTAPESEMDLVGNILTLKDEIDIEGLKETKEFTVDLNETLGEYRNIRLEEDMAPTVVVTVTIDEVGSRTVNFPVSELKLSNAPGNKRLIFSPTDRLSISVRSSDERLNVITADDIQAEIDLSGCEDNGSYTLPVKVTLPEDCELGSEVSIVVNVEDEQEAEVELQTEE